jgi:zinc protease
MRRTLRIAATAGALSLAVLTGLHAQGAATQTQTQTVEIKGKAPVSKEMLKVKLPRPAELDLGNGLHLMVLEDRRAPQVSFQLLVRGAGGYFDPQDRAGLASLTASMMREGTASKNTQQIAEALETMASSVTVSTGMSSAFAVVSGSSLTENFEPTFAIAADVLLHPTFPADEFDRLKTRTKAGLIQQRSNPGFLGSEMLSSVLFGSHPASRVSMTPEGVDAITRDALVEFHGARYVPDHAVLALAGDISMADARKIIEPMLSGWKKSGTPVPATTDPPAVGPAKVYLIARPNSVQTSLLVGTQAISRTAPDYDVVSVMNAVIGGGPTGRLFTHLREEKGYTYGAYSSLSASQFRGSWIASTDVRTEVTEPALTDLMAEVTRMRDEAVPADEFDARRRGIIASFALSLESPAAVLNNHLTRWLYGLPADYWDRLPERTMAVTQSDVQAAARKYLDPSRLQIVAVGDPTKIKDILAKFGTLEVYDTNGKRIEP